MALDDQPRDIHGKYIKRPKSNKKKTGVFVWILRIIFLPFWLLYEVTNWGFRSFKAGGARRIVGLAGMGAAWVIFLIGFSAAISGRGDSVNQNTNAPLPTATTAAVGMKPTNTKIPTKTPAPTNTPKPANTPTQPPPPQVYSGNGDMVEIVTPVGAAIMDIKYTGGSNFIVENFDSAGNQIDLLVNTIGAYSGRIELDFMADEETSMLQIQASGPWSITIAPLSLDILKSINVPGTYQGFGDDVIYVDGNARMGTFDASGKSNFVVWTIGDSRDLAINEIAPYSGKVIIPKGTLLLIVKADGRWTATLE